MGTRPHARGRYAACALMAAMTVGVAGCSASRTAGRPATPSPAASTTAPHVTCTKLVSYWAGEALKGSKWAGLDWEQKGLSNEQYAIHEEVVAAGRAEAARRGRAAGLRLTDQLAEKECRAANGATGSSENWRPPR
ncbi:hypothetical protein AS594_25775 [Streptomyces agglomeratus]|uniref:Lipoprotein n=1 Tax=Streptomyces agglomeratus TaxID=285458 RepID=A0A1E5PCX0_9ACTN|nr:hypothetical protein AS594_25775 [Streptomyces agglomeratus]